MIFDRVRSFILDRHHARGLINIEHVDRASEVDHLDRLLHRRIAMESRLGRRIAYWMSGLTGIGAADPDGERKDMNRVNRVLLPLLLLALIALLCKGVGTRAICAMLLWSAACLCAGGTVGFLFGIPKSGSPRPHQLDASATDAEPAAAMEKGSESSTRPNTNLEEISDWLTKIIVGLTLVHLQDIEKRVQGISANAAASFAAAPSSSDISFATALIATFSTMGFLAGYLYTRLFIQGAFARSDGELRRYSSVVAQEARKRALDPMPADSSALPTAAQIRSSERVRLATPSANPDVVLTTMRGLALEYEQTRASMPAGAARTKAMAAVVQRMNLQALSAVPYLPLLTVSNSAGERLAAIVILKFQFDIAHLDWLVERLTTEVAFLAYHAAGALLRGVRILGEPDKGRLKAGVEHAQRTLDDRKLDDAGVKRVLAEILAA